MGRASLTGCPSAWLPAWIYELFDLLAWATLENGRILPVAGGLLDQTCSFIEALAEYRSEHARWDRLEEERGR